MSVRLKNLREVARESGEDVSDAELQAIIDEFDTSSTDSCLYTAALIDSSITPIAIDGTSRCSKIP